MPATADFQKLSHVDIANSAVRAAIESMTDLLAGDNALLVDVTGVEIVKTGIEYSLASGPHTFTPEDLADAAEAVNNPNIQVPRIKLGHDGPLAKITSSDEPAVGTVHNLRVSEDGQTLYGDYKGVPSWLAGIMASAYPSRSIEGGLNVEKNGHTYRLVITAVSLLGVVWPGCSSIEDIQALYSKEGPEGVKVIEARQGGAMPEKVAASVQTEEVRRAFYEQVAVGEQSYWWICAHYQVPPVLIVEGSDGESYSVGYTIGSDDSINFDDPTPVTVQYVDDSGKVAAEEAEPVAVFASRAESRSETDKQEDDVKLTPEQMRLLRARLGKTEEELPDDASEEQINAALAETPSDDPPEGGDGGDGGDDDEAETPAGDEEEEETDGGEVEASGGAKLSMKQIQASLPKGLKVIDEGTLADLKAGATAGLTLAKEKAAETRDTTIAAAISAGKFPPARKKHWETLWANDPQGTKEIIDGLEPGLVPVEAATDTEGETWNGDEEAYPKQWLGGSVSAAQGDDVNNNGGRRRVTVGED